MKEAKLMVLFGIDEAQMQHKFSFKKPQSYLTGKGIELESKCKCSC